MPKVLRGHVFSFFVCMPLKVELLSQMVTLDLTEGRTAFSCVRASPLSSSEVVLCSCKRVADRGSRL